MALLISGKSLFVQTRTPATNCVDLGCKYTLTVDGAGDSLVEVTMGRVAFEDRGREVYVTGTLVHKPIVKNPISNLQ